MDKLVASVLTMLHEWQEKKEHPIPQEHIHRYGPYRLRASADRMADQPDGEDGEAPTPGAWRRPSQVLEGLSTAEGRQARVAVDEAADPDECGAGVVPQGPADGLADEELRGLLVGLDDVAQQARVGTVLVLELADDRAAPDPQVLVECPAAQVLVLVGMREQHRPDGVARLVHEVPPGTGAKEVPVEVQGLDPLDVLTSKAGTDDSEHGETLLSSCRARYSEYGTIFPVHCSRISAVARR